MDGIPRSFFHEQYAINNPVTIGNPNIKPEPSPPTNWDFLAPEARFKTI